MVYEKGLRRDHGIGEQHVQSLAENLGVTHKDMVKIEEAEISFEDDIAKISKYWK